MISVIAHGVPKKRIGELSEFVKSYDASIQNEGQPNMCVKCKDLASAKKIGDKVISMKK